MIHDERQKLLVAQALAGQVDRAHRKTLALIGLGHQPPKRTANYPAINIRRYAVALGRFHKESRGNNTAALVTHAQQYLVMGPLLFLLQRHDRLPEQLETIFFERIVYACCPLRFAAPAHEVDIVFPETVSAISTRLFGGSARTVCGAE